MSRFFLGSLLSALIALLLVATPGEAHWADLAVAEIAVGETKAQITLVFPTGLVATADDDRDGRLSADEVRAHRGELQALLGERIRLTDGGRAGTLAVEAVDNPAPLKSPGVAPGPHSAVRLVYTWPQPIRALTIRYALFLPGVSTASCLATILHAGRVRSFVFTPENREFSLTVGGRAIWDQAASFLALGIAHILTGYDHILFLISLLMLGGGLRHLIKIVSAFTVAHSLTLTLAVLDLVTLPSRWVESAIALSIVYVAAENFWRRDVALRNRWIVTFVFGLVHGLGFASVLKDMALPRSSLALSLVGFNLGVEVGQVAIVGAAFIMLQILRAWPREALFRRLVSAGAVAFGLIWFVQRALLT